MKLHRGEWYMPIIKDLEWTFDTNAETYGNIRPGYVDELYEDIFKHIDIDDSRVS